jgi:hypothetical protein
LLSSGYDLGKGWLIKKSSKFVQNPNDDNHRADKEFVGTP